MADSLPADLEALLRQASATGTPAPIDVDAVLQALGGPAMASPSSSSVATPPFVAPSRPAASAMPIAAGPPARESSSGGGIDWHALLNLVAPLMGTLGTHGPARAGFMDGFMNGQEQVRQHKEQQRQIAAKQQEQGTHYTFDILDKLRGLDNPSDWTALRDRAVKHVPPGVDPTEISGLQFPQSQANRALVAEIRSQIEGLKDYNLDDLASSGAVLKLKNGQTIPIRAAMEIVRARPLDAGGQPIVKPTKLGNTEEERFIAKWAKEHGSTVDALTTAQEMQARTQFRESGKIAATGGVDAQLTDLVAMWKDAHPGREVPKDVMVKLRLEANKVNDKATGLSGPGANSQLDPDGIEYAATEYRVTGKMPALGMGNGAARAAIINGAARQAKELGQSAAAAIQRQAAYKADGAALTKMRTMSSAAEAFETKALAQADIVDGLSLKVDRTKYPIINDGLLTAKARVLGDANTQLLYNALTTFTTEYAKIMEGSTGSAAGSTEGARAAAARLISAGLNKGQLAQTLDLMRKEMRLTIHGYDATIGHITERMGGTNPTAPATGDRIYYDASGNPVKK